MKRAHPGQISKSDNKQRKLSAFFTSATKKHDENPKDEIDKGEAELKLEFEQESAIKSTPRPKTSKAVLKSKEPPNWREVWNLIEEVFRLYSFFTLQQMRIETKAPVDTMGCHMLADKTVDEKVMLSALI